MATVSTQNLTTAELDGLTRFQSGLPEGELRYALSAMAATLSCGHDVIVSDAEDHYTTTEAAKLLGVSRAHLYKVLDSGALPFVSVGTNRRIRVQDFENYRARAFDARREAALMFSRAGSLDDAALDAM
jgi:excisionase family DNA binding protein